MRAIRPVPATVVLATGKLRGHSRGRLVLGVRELWLRVQPVAHLDGARQLVLDAREQL